MKISDLNERCSFIGVVLEKTPFGETKKVEKVLFSCWCSVREQLVTEVSKTIGTVYEDTISIGIRQVLAKKIEATMKVELDGERYEIKKVSPDRKNKELAIVYIKKVA
ncbi:phage head closure protein [Kurthia massiliensis]|uniref:phage head closure protein n=1 Tax=Kurthia massiliensis TaxID=1033739 RepID=UPI000288632F|nr:phage head closure protein [Kurthia massiliensis]